MSDTAPTERERLLAEYERRAGVRPRWLDELTNDGLAWHLDQLEDALDAETARERLAEIQEHPDRLITGAALAERLKRCDDSP